MELESFCKQFATIFLAGGKGLRLGGSCPKQFLFLKEKRIVHYTFPLFEKMAEVVVVAEEEWHPLFPPCTTFAKPGKERQDSVYNGLSALSSDAEFVIIHDSARPFLEEEELYHVMKEGMRTGAAALATPLSSTIKQARADLFVERTLPRERLYEIQTPQVIRKELLLQAFERVTQEGLMVTDDLSLVESLGLPVKLVLGSSKNIKITSPFDLQLAALLANA